MEQIHTYPSTKPLYRGTQIIWYVLAVLETLLSIRFFLKLLGANPEAGFTSFIYTATEIFVAPFTRVFGNTNLDGALAEWGTLLAIVVYWIIALLAIRLLAGSRRVTEKEAASNLRDQM
ncbi:MAG: YggT family protein [Candidatus Paceibacterota bacterium]